MTDLTIPDAEAVVSYPVVGSTTGPFNVTFPISAAADLRVSVGSIELASNAFVFTPTATVNGGYQTGYITLNTAVDTTTVLIWRDIPLTRSAGYLPGPLDINGVNAEMAKLWAAVQDARLLTDRALRLPLSEAGIASLVAAASRANQLLGFDASGNPIPVAPGSPGLAQPLDATLTALAALVIASGKVPFGTGPDAFALADSSAIGRALWALTGTPSYGHVPQYTGSAWVNDPLDQNLLINGDFRINQEAPATNADGTYAHDQFYVLTQSNPIAVTTLTDPESGAAYGARLTQSNATPQRFGYAQPLETRDVRDLRAAVATMIARLRLSTSANLRAAIVEWTGTADSITKDIVNDWTSSTYTTGNFFISTTTNVLAVSPSIGMTANTWAWMNPLSATFGASMNNVIVFIWTEATCAQNVTLDFNRWGLWAGSTPKPFTRKKMSQVLAECQRFWEKSYDLATAAGTVSAVGARSGSDQTGGVVDVSIQFVVRKRTAPVVTPYNPATGASGNARTFTTGGLGTDRTATAVNIGEGSCYIQSTTSDTTIFTHYVANSRL